MNTIQNSNLTKVYSSYVKAAEGKRQSKSLSFSEQVNAGVLEKRKAASVDTFQKQETAETGKVSLESMLKSKYPNLVYNVGDGTSSYWNTRSDYPYEALFQEGEQATQTIEGWKPSGADTKKRRDVAVAPNSKAVMIHPKAQERMENDPAFAKEVMERIESWWAYDIARNEAIAPGCTTGMSQAIAIGADGEIANTLSCGGVTPNNNKSADSISDKDEDNWWVERMARHAMLMQLWMERGKEMNSFSLLGDSSSGSFSGSSNLNRMLSMRSGLPAEQSIANMVQNGLKEKLGDTVCGIPTDEVIEQTWDDISRCRAIRNSMMG